MKIIFISDTHAKHQNLQIPPCDLLIHAGDISNVGRPQEVQQFLDWFASLPIKYKVFIGGNHDFLLERQAALFREMLSDDYYYLENESIAIEGIKIWGSPISPFFNNWAFNRQRGPDIKKYWDEIPDDIDILLTHGPPLGKGDKTYSGEAVGCADLTRAIERIQPRYHVFGHIHEGYGMYQDEHTTYINASVLNLRYELVNAPVVIEW